MLHPFLTSEPARDVPTMYHANGKQRGTAGNNGDLQARSEQGKIPVYQEERLDLAACS